MREAVSIASLWAAGLLAGCPSQAGPNDDAIAAYLERDGLAPGVSLPLADGATPDAVKAVARRVALTVARGTGLPDLDTGPGVTDPYVVIEYEGQRFRTSVVEGHQNPVWGDTFILDVRPGGVLIVRLMDEDSLSKDEQIGTQSQVLPDLRIGETKRLLLTFRNGQGGSVDLTLTGMVRP